MARALEVATRAAARARDLILAECARPDGPRGEIDHAPVDDEAELAIRQILESEFSDWGYLGEETGSKTATEGTSYVWFVDPNDGTSSMQRGYRGHAVSIGLVHDGIPVLGVVWAVDAPVDRGDLISWAEGCGPIRRNGQALQPQALPTKLTADDVVGLSQGAMRHPLGYLPCVAPARYVTSPSIAYRLALVATGDYAATLSLNYLHAWDFAAGHALVRAAGGVLLDERGREFSYPAEGTGAATRVFAGHVDVVRDLVRRPWASAQGSGFGSAAPPPQLAPARAQVGGLVHDPDVLDRAQACLLGLLLGGSELGLTLARQLVFRGAFDQEAVAAAYAAWYHAWTHSLDPIPCDHPWCRPSSVEPSVKTALSAITADDVHERRAASGALASADPSQLSAAALARVAPIGIWGAFRPLEEVDAAARQDAQLTHPNPVCQAASALLAITLAAAIRDGHRPDATYAFALKHAPDEGVREAVRAAASTPPARDDSVLTVLQSAFFELLHRTEPAQRDTATGALLGAVLGRAAFPEQAQRMLLSCRPMPGQPGVRHPRPAVYWPNDALIVAERLLTTMGSPG